jgi:hypothetical protein
MSLRSVAEAIAVKGCQVIWQGYTEKMTCLGVMRHAAENEEDYMPEYHLQLIAGEHRCEHCQLQQALDEDDRDAQEL